MANEERTMPEKLISELLIPPEKVREGDSFLTCPKAIPSPQVASMSMPSRHNWSRASTN